MSDFLKDERSGNLTASPLSWPTGWDRTPAGRRQLSKFSINRTIGEAVREVLAEVRRLGGTECIISSNMRLRIDGLPISEQRQPEDTGVAVYFILQGKPVVFACDKWSKVQDNLWAVARHIENLRESDRYGVGNLDRAFTGYKQLSAPAEESWWVVLDVSPNAGENMVRAAYRTLAKKYHPDSAADGGDLVAFHRLQRAFDAAIKQLREHELR